MDSYVMKRNQGSGAILAPENKPKLVFGADAVIIHT